MNCSVCHAENPPQNRFCEECGAPLETCCPKCGSPVRAGTKFCGACGQRLVASLADEALPSESGSGADYGRSTKRYTPKHLAEKILTARSALEGERRHVTVLFADMAGFTSLAEKLDPEEVHEIVDRCFDHITTEVHRFEGTINQYTGDGVMALFGAPIAHEDGPRRAVHAALGIQRAMREYAKELEAARGFAVSLRIGMNTGLVVVGKIGDDLRMDYTAVGDTTNLAARLQQVAEPGTVVISEATQRLVSGFFETRDLGERNLKGHAAPVRAHEVIRARMRRARLEIAAERGLTPLVGRERELETLEDLFRQVKAAHGQVAFLVGDAGIGKSRLIYEFRRRLSAANERVTWLEGRCVSFGQSNPFLPVIDQLRENFGVEEADGDPEIIAKVENGMRAIGGLEPHIPYVRYLLAVDPGEPALAALDPATRRKRLFDALAALILRGAARRPIVFVFEDLHWIDTSTQEFLAWFLDSAVAVPLLFLLTYRPGYVPPFGTRSFLTTMNLHSLSETETAAMAGRVLGSENFPVELKAELMEKAAGIPLFIEEVAKTLLDLGVLRRDAGGFRLVKGIGAVSVPETIQGIIMARLDRLGEDGKRTVQLASVIGRQFMLRLLEKVAGLTGKLDGLLRELKALEIVYEQGLLQEPAYVFKHAVIQDVAYQSLLVQRRKELHRVVGEAIEELYPNRLADHYAELAHHFFQGEAWRKSMEYGVLAGDRAAHAFANSEARKHYERALRAALSLEPPPDDLGLAGVHSKLGTVLITIAEYEAALTELRRALELVRRAGDRRREIEALVAISTVYNYSHKGEPALEYNEQALAIARELGDRGLQAVCLGNRASLRTAGYGQVIESTADAEEALQLSNEIADPGLRAQTLCFLGQALVWRGQLDRALPHLLEAAKLAEQVHAGFFFAFSSFMIGNAYVARGEYEEALGWYRRLSDYAETAGDKFFLARVRNLVGGVHLELYDLERAIEINLEADELAERYWPWPEPRGHSLLKVGLGHLEQGNLGHADDFFRRAWALLDGDTWYRWRWHIPLLRARGELALAAGRYDEAWGFAEQSLAMATESDSRKHAARAQRLQGEILAAQGRFEEAARLLESSVAVAERLRTPREVWLGSAALGQVLARLGKEKEAERQLEAAVQSIESIAGKIGVAELQRSFLGAERVSEIYRTLGRRPRSS